MRPRLRLACATVVILLAVAVSIAAWSHGDYEDVWACSSASSAGIEPVLDTCGQVPKSSVWWVVGPAAIALLALGDAIVTGRRIAKTPRQK